MNEILILMGGYNEEHEVSLSTAYQIKKTLTKMKIKNRSLLVNPKNFKKKIAKYSKDLIIFNALHGTFGENGELQKILKNNNFKFTHSGVHSSKTCFDKIKSKNIIMNHKISSPRFYQVKINNINEKILNKFKKKFSKFVIKPNQSGSSFGIRIIKSEKDIKSFLKNIHLYKNEIKNHNTLIIEEYIEGRELTVAVLVINKKIQALEVTEIKSKNIFFDYKAKYTKGYSKHILPAKINKKNYNQCLNFAIKAHKILKCNAISRTDFILNKKNKLYYLETNTQPGLTQVSLVPEQARFKKISFRKIIETIINNINE